MHVLSIIVPSLSWCPLFHLFENKLFVPMEALTKTDKYQHHGWNTKAQCQQLSHNLCVGVITHRDLRVLLIAIKGSKLVSKQIKMPLRISSVQHNQDLVIWAALLGLVVNFALAYCMWKLVPTLWVGIYNMQSNWKILN